MKIVSLIGGRPQFVKEAVLNREFKKHSQINEILINSGQHYDYNMAGIFLEKLNITAPKYDLKVGSGTHAEMTAKIMIGFEKLMYKIKPDQILVYGDTNTALAGALVGAKLKIPVSHVEAGIRMLPKDMPEEINRVLTDRISDYLFCPSQRAVKNLKKEGIIEGVHFTGDVMYDLFLYMQKYFDFELFKELHLKKNGYTLVTLHRDYNVDDPERFEKILKDLDLLSKTNRIVFPMHPRTRKRIKEFGFKKYTKKLDILEPIGYLSLMALLSNCKNVVTDSGGIQKESYFSHKRAYLFMPDPAWHELVDFGVNILCEPGELKNHMEKEKEVEYVKNIYGDGNAGEKIAKILIEG